MDTSYFNSISAIHLYIHIDNETPVMKVLMNKNKSILKMKLEAIHTIFIDISDFK